MNLPVEVIQHIFYFLSPCEIVRLRQVSKQFHNITRNSALWRRVYANAGLLLPPGPFSSQSTRYLERTLVQSELVSNTWTSHPLKMISRISSSWKRKRSTGWAIVFGRWCIFLQKKTIQCHDTDTDTYHALYDGTAHPKFRFMAGTATGDSGKRMCLLLVNYNPPRELIKMLEFYVNDDSFSEPEIMDWSHIGSQPFDTGRSTDDLHGSAPFIVVRKCQPCVVLDLRTRYLYRLPVPKVPDDLSNALRIHPAPSRFSYNASTEVVLTKTHVITVQMLQQSSRDVYVLIQAFVAPDSAILRDRIEVGELCLTHQVVVRTPLYSFGLLRDSIVDPVTGSVNIRLLHITSYTILADSSQAKYISCLDLTLPERVSTADVLPMSVRSQKLLTSSGQRTSEWYTACNDGYVRGLFLTILNPADFHVSSMRKFTIDASGEECTMTRCDPCPVDFCSNHTTFDGVRGRIHYTQHANTINSLHTVITVDVA